MSTPDQYNLIEVHGLTKRFGARDAIVNLSLSVASGMVFGLVGANGGGKTTSLRMLAGLLLPDHGNGCVLGFDLRNSSQDIRAHVGYMSQRFALHGSLNVHENLRIRAQLFNVHHVTEASERMLHRFGLDAFREQRCATLSGGWARRVQLACALLHQPRVLLLDEPTAGLDAAARHAVWRHIHELAAAGTGIVVSTHDLAEAERCDVIALLSQGRVRAMGNREQVIDAAPIAVLIAHGSHPGRLRSVIENEPCVIAAYPHAQELRVVIDADALSHIIKLIQSSGGQAHITPPTLEDVTLAWSNHLRDRVA